MTTTAFANYSGATPPHMPTTTQLGYMDQAWTQRLVTAANTQGTVGMYGHHHIEGETCPWGECIDAYYFYLKFIPYTDIRNTQNAVFRMWFQMGNEESNWDGVQFVKTGVSPMTTDEDLNPVSATNSEFLSNSWYSTNSQFRGRLYAVNTYEVEIWRWIPDWETTIGDGSYTRIEEGRRLRCSYDPAVIASDKNIFYITLQGGISNFAFLATAIAATGLLAF